MLGRLSGRDCADVLHEFVNLFGPEMGTKHEL